MVNKKIELKLLFWKRLTNTLFCNRALIVKKILKTKKTWKWIKPLTSIGLHIVIYHFKCKLKNRNKFKEKTINKIKKYFSFKLIGEIVQLQISTRF